MSGGITIACTLCSGIHRCPVTNGRGQHGIGTTTRKRDQSDCAVYPGPERDLQGPRHHDSGPGKVMTLGSGRGWVLS